MIHRLSAIPALALLAGCISMAPKAELPPVVETMPEEFERAEVNGDYRPAACDETPDLASLLSSQEAEVPRRASVREECQLNPDLPTGKLTGNFLRIPAGRHGHVAQTHDDRGVTPIATGLSRCLSVFFFFS